ncbi:MAG: class I SAM-dependent methyltransferase [Candidatus Hodarchaeales archaeon]|jgi:SAM-dependent methyltransferase
MEENVFNLIKDGYNKVAQDYRNEKSDSLLYSSLFQKWLSEVNRGPILDLGCGSGYPLLDILPPEIHYIGVDISEGQINLARNQYPNREFIQEEMLLYCQNQPKNRFSGVIILFSLFHLPRYLHYSFLTEVKRISQEESPLLLLVPEEANKGSMDHFFGQEMWWSSYSYDYYMKKLRSLGYSGLITERKVEVFAGEEETNWYLFGFT